MKFQDQLEYHEIPEWLEFYINYIELKRILRIALKDLERQATSVIHNKDDIVEKQEIENKKVAENIDINDMSESLLKNQFENSNNISPRKFTPNVDTNEIESNYNTESPENRYGESYVYNKNNDEDIYIDNNESIENNQNNYNNENNQAFNQLPSKVSELNNDHNESYSLTDWIRIYKKEITRISSFYISKKKELNHDYLSLKEKIISKKEADKITHIKEKKDKNLKRTISMNTVLKENKEFDEVGFAVSWKRACSNIFTQVSWLHGFQNINIIAAERLLIKFKDIFKNEAISEKLFLEKTNSPSLTINDIYTELLEYTKKMFKTPTYVIAESDEKTKSDTTITDKETESKEFTDVNKEILNLEADNDILDIEVLKLRQKINKFYADNFTGGNQLQSKSQLENRMSGYRIYDLKLIALHLGIISSSLLIFVMITLIPSQTDLEVTTIFNYFPIFHTYFMFVFALFGAALNIAIFRKYRVNYIFILEIDPKSRLTQSELIRTSLLFFSIWIYLLILMYCSINFEFFGGRFYYLPIAIIGVFTIILFLPFHVFYSHFRKALLITVFKNFFPIGKNGVKFRDFLFGDILTSLTRPFQNISLTICLITCEPCKEKNIRGYCSRNLTPALIISLIPYLMRFFQCCNKYHYTQMAWPHIANALKYAASIVNVFTSWLFNNGLIDYWLMLTVAGISTAYLIFWDFKMDWALFNFQSSNFLLRDKLVYPKYFYYGAMVINVVLRLTWLIALLNFNMNKELEFFIYGVLEVWRRIQWAFFRIENENISNFEKYRNILAIPALPLD